MLWELELAVANLAGDPQQLLQGANCSGSSPPQGAECVPHYALLAQVWWGAVACKGAHGREEVEYSQAIQGTCWSFKSEEALRRQNLEYFPINFAVLSLIWIALPPIPYLLKHLQGS